MRGRADQALFIDEQSWQAGQWFGINPSSYDLWRGSTVEETPEEAMLRWNHSLDLPQPRTPGARHRLACEVMVLKDKLEVAGVFPWKQSATHVTYSGWFHSMFRNMFRESRERVVALFRPRPGYVPRGGWRTAHVGQLLTEPIDLRPDPAFTYASARAGKSEALRVVAIDHARRGFTFTADAVYARPLPPRSRVPAGLQKARLDGRRKR